MSYTPPSISNCTAMYNEHQKILASKAAADQAAWQEASRRRIEAENRIRDQKYNKIATELLTAYFTTLVPSNFSQGGKVYSVKIPSPFVETYDIEYVITACNKLAAPWTCSFTTVEHSNLIGKFGINAGRELLCVKEGNPIIMIMTYIS